MGETITLPDDRVGTDRREGVQLRQQGLLARSRYRQPRAAPEALSSCSACSKTTRPSSHRRTHVRHDRYDNGSSTATTRPPARSAACCATRLAVDRSNDRHWSKVRSARDVRRSLPRMPDEACVRAAHGKSLEQRQGRRIRRSQHGANNTGRSPGHQQLSTRTRTWLGICTCTPTRHYSPSPGNLTQPATLQSTWDTGTAGHSRSP